VWRRTLRHHLRRGELVLGRHQLQQLVRLRRHMYRQRLVPELPGLFVTGVLHVPRLHERAGELS
jgi:hypothetical protein